MIGFVGSVLAAGADLAEVLDELPDPPALRWSAFLVEVTPWRPLMGVLPWAVGMRKVRPWRPIGLVLHVDEPVRRVLSAVEELGLFFEPLLDPRRILDRRLVSRELEGLFSRGVGGRVFLEWVDRWDVREPEMLDLLVSVANHGVSGGRAYRVSGRMRGPSLSERTIRRRLLEQGLPTLGWLLRYARLRSVSLRRELGMRRVDAVLAAGFGSVKLYEKAAARFR